MAEIFMGPKCNPNGLKPRVEDVLSVATALHGVVNQQAQNHLSRRILREADVLPDEVGPVAVALDAVLHAAPVGPRVRRAAFAADVVHVVLGSPAEPRLQLQGPRRLRLPLQVGEAVPHGLGALLREQVRLPLPPQHLPVVPLQARLQLGHQAGR
eukprot:CAMPEP_0194722694 /NCGR_PEP_ID=MMETSP0296-20130528/13778_1 /TAXON_ID=39354 /ORGANISM="Heterosigma akashiwo, Strain CCMP2393" /LENGTH=154 /DNA_ID=CAMNT_0039625791 /DNA_START=819 /DNA_END=1280 /DNA_ORIENTATION=+